MSGRLAAVSLTDTNDTLIYTVQAGKFGVLTANLAARLAAAKVRLAITSGGAPTDADWIEPGAPLAEGGVLERTGLTLSAGQKIYAGTDIAGVSVGVWGILEAV